MAGFKSVINAMKQQAASAASETENKTEKTTAQVTEQPTEQTKEQPKVEVAEQPKAESADTKPRMTTADRVAAIKAAVKNGVVIGSELTDEENHKWAVFTNPPSQTDNMKTIANHLKYFNAKWEFDGDGDNRTLKRVLLPAAVMVNAEAAEAAHAARLERNERVKARIEKREATKSEQPKTESKPTEQPKEQPAKSEQPKSEGGKTFTVEQVRQLMRCANSHISDEAINILINNYNFK